MRQLIARYNDYFVIGLKDRAFLVFDTLGSTSTSSTGSGTIVELLPSQDPKAIQEPASVSTTGTVSATVSETVSDALSNTNPSSAENSSNDNTNTTTKNNSEQAQQNIGDRVPVHDRQKSSDEQLNEICAVAIIGDNTADNSSTATITNTATDTDIILRCAVARNNKSLDIYTVKIEELLQTSTSTKKTTQSSSIVYRTPKRVSCFTFANLTAAATDASATSESPSKTNKTAPLLISGDVAGDSYAYNLLENGQRLLLGHTASMLTDIAIVINNDDECSSNSDNSSSSRSDRLLLTSDRDEKIRISRFPDSFVIEGFLLGHTAYVTAFTVIPSAKLLLLEEQDASLPSSSSSSSSSLVVSCGGDRTLRLWNLGTRNEISSTSTCAASVTDDGSTTNNNNNEIPTAIAASCCGRIVAVIFDDSKRLSIYKIITTTKKKEGQGEHGDAYASLELLGSVDCPSQPLSVDFYEAEGVESSNGNDNGNGDIVLAVLMKDPDYIVLYNIQNSNQDDDDKPIAVPRKEIRVMQALRDVATEEKIAMPNTILEKDDYGKPVIEKQNENRGPAATEAPWNRVERIEIAKEREKRRKKKPKLVDN